MNTQRMVGGLLSFFTLSVVIGHAVRGSLSLYDFFYSILFALFITTIFKESYICKALQTVAILSAGFSMMLTHESAYIGLVILSVAFLQAYTYGFFKTKGPLKMILWGISYLCLFIFTSSNDFIEALLWLLICIATQAMFYINAMDLIEKAKRADELEKLFLKESLKDSLEAGLVLSNEIKTKGTENGCQE